METETLSLNLDKICRICLCEDGEMFSIYSELYEEENCVDELPRIYEIITSLSSMKIKADDGLPQSLCEKCVKNAHISFKFRKSCDRSQAILESYLNQSKNETLLEENSNDLINDDTLVLNENDLDLAENYIKETLIQEAQENTDIQGDSVLNPDEFFATDEEHLKLNLEKPKDKNEFVENGLKEEDNSDEDKIGNLKNYEKVLPSGERLFACKMCDKVYKNGSSLRAHIRGHHKKKRPYNCEICGKGFRMYGSFFYHKRMHTGEQPHVCKICGKKYKQSGTLTAHMRVHTGQKPFLCSLCGRGFRQQPDLNYHMRTHTKEKPYQCAVCGKTMSMQSHLVQHMRTHTGERPFQCKECDKAFPTSTCLKRHAMIHTGEKPHTCDVCQKSFNRLSSLNIHSKTHTDYRPHVCPICNKGFIQAHTLKNHLLTHNATQNMRKR